MTSTKEALRITEILVRTSLGTARGGAWQTLASLLRELLDACYFVTRKSHEHGPVWRRSVNPIFNFVSFGVALTDLVCRFPDRRHHHLAIHTYPRSAFLYRLLDVGR